MYNVAGSWKRGATVGEQERRFTQSLGFQNFRGAHEIKIPPLPKLWLHRSVTLISHSSAVGHTVNHLKSTTKQL